MAKPVVAVSLGDPSGVGPEVLARALANLRVKRALLPLVFGDGRVFARAAKLARVKDGLARLAAASSPLPRGGGLVELSSLSEAEAPLGRPTPAGAKAQRAYFEAAVEALQQGRAQALCTAPVSKAQMTTAGSVFTGHTEYLARAFGREVLMMLAGPELRVAVATTHLPISQVAKSLSVEGLVEALRLLDRELRKRFGIREPRIAVCGLNPHAGEGGLLGDEERRIIAPAIERAKARGVRAEGPLAADGLFGRAIGRWDAVLAMYHDQGLIPVKLLHRDTAVNVTLGLPLPRTSPDHGVGYDIAAEGKADPTSMIQALLLAARLARGGRR